LDHLHFSPASRAANVPTVSEQTRRALVFRIGALGDVLLTRRLTYSLSLAGYRSTLFAPTRHAALLLADPWMEGILDSESPGHARVFQGEWPSEAATVDVAVVISASGALQQAASVAARSSIQVSPIPRSETMSIAQQWAESVSSWAPAFEGPLPRLVVAREAGLMECATVIHSGSGSTRKNWPHERFTELARLLRRDGHRVLWVRGPAEPDTQHAAEDFESARLSLDALAATLARARLFIGNDSGVSHLAAATGAPTVALFGPTSEAVWRPDGPIVRTVAAGNGEIASLSVQTVREAIDELGTLKTQA
jgi:ADP-heptose:LPS heptosyltransferase